MALRQPASPSPISSISMAPSPPMSQPLVTRRSAIIRSRESHRWAWRLLDGQLHRQCHASDARRSGWPGSDQVSGSKRHHAVHSQRHRRPTARRSGASVSSTGTITQAGVNILNPTSVTTNVNVTGVGTVKLRLTVTGACNSTNTDDVVLTVNPPPNSAITGPYAVTASSTGNSYSAPGPEPISPTVG